MNDKDTVVVPRVPTPEMIEAGRIQCDVLDNGPAAIWEDMLAAAPSTSVREEVEIATATVEATGYLAGDEARDVARAVIAALKPSTDKGGVTEDHVPDARNMVEPVWEAQPGRVVWHTSEEGGGPDVGITIGLGDGKILWVGERSDKEGGGLGMLVYEGTGITANAELGDYGEVYALLEGHVAPALAATPTDLPPLQNTGERDGR